jgi:hypothetical protein
MSDFHASASGHNTWFSCGASFAAQVFPKRLWCGSAQVLGTRFKPHWIENQIYTKAADVNPHPNP